MKKTLLTTCLLFVTYFMQAQIILNEIETDAGNFEGTAEWIELKNIGANPQDMSCWRLSNGGSLQLSVPQGLIVPAGGYLLIGNASKMTCATCDFKYLHTQFTFNPDGYGLGSGIYNNVVFLNTDILANGGCDCMVGSGAINNGGGNGDRIVLFDANGNIMDALMFANGDAYGAATLTVNFNGVGACAPLPNITIPATTDVVYNGHTICNDLSGCNSSYARLPDGNNGAVVTWAQSGNLACMGCTNPCGANINTASADIPTPGLENSSVGYTATFDGNLITNPITTIQVCGNAPLTFIYTINNFTNVALTATQASGNLGSYAKFGIANPINFSSAVFNNATGVTTLSTTVIPNVGTNNYEFVWGDANTNCASCPGSNSVLVPNDISNINKECYVYRKIIVVREDPLGGSPVASCSLPGSITVSGAMGTNIQYTLQKQTVAAGPFTTIVGPQNGNSFGGIIDDDADPNLPNYQVLVSSINVACANPTPLVVSVPNACLGNPACAQYATTGPGMPTFNPANGTYCPGSTFSFSVDITGVCNTGNVELMYDFDPMFDPYTQGISLGIANTIVGATPPAITAGGKVFINEFVPRPSLGTCAGTPNGANANSGEWFELYNAGPGVADIGGWIVADGDWTATIPAGTSMAANSYYLIGGGGTFCSSGTIPDLNIETCNCATLYPNGSDIMNLTDGNEQIALFDCSGNFIDGVLWGGGQGLPDAINNNALATGCGDYIIAKTVNLPAAASFANSGGGFSGSNEGRYRNSGNTWTTFTYGNGTPKTANPTIYNGAAISLGTSCPPPIVTANITAALPDTCNQLGNVNITVKAIYKPEPVAPCQTSDVIASTNYTFPLCEMLTLSGDGDYCDPATAPLTVTTSSALMGNYIINLTNSVNNASINPATGAGPFITNVNYTGIWTIDNVTAPLGTCVPRISGSANVNILTNPSITSYPISVDACYIYTFDLATIENQIITTPFTTTFNWYDMAVGGTPINTLISPLANVTYYVAASTGAPTNCEGARVPININVLPLPNVPTVVCNGITATFTQPVPDCFPTPCMSGVEYSANGINWSNNNTFSAADLGWAGWGSPLNSTLYIRNAANNNCYNYATFINPCSAPLPITLLHFDGRLNIEKNVELIWTTSMEKNVSNFEIEKSIGNNNFIKIASVKAVGNSDVEQTYKSIDEHAFNGINYYRLKTTDNDGKYTYSNIIQVILENGKSTIASIYPNPASTQINIDFSISKAENTTLEILNMIGETVYSQTVNLQKGFNNIIIPISQIANGNYIVRVKLLKEIQVLKFCKE